MKWKTLKINIVFSVMILITLVACLKLQYSRSLNGMLEKETGAGSRGEVTNETGPFYRPKQFSLSFPVSHLNSCHGVRKGIYEEGTLPLIALASYPGSGNTWLRHLIEMATGVCTGSMYSDIELAAEGFRGELRQWNCGCTIVQKTHEPFNSFLGFSRAILLIRDPFSSVVSFVNYMDSGGNHVGLASPGTFKKKGWNTFLTSSINKWFLLAKSWITSEIPVLVIHYEVLKSQTRSQLKRICRFIGERCDNLETTCFQENIEGNLHRKHRFHWTPSYPEASRLKKQQVVSALQKILNDYNHPALPVSQYKNSFSFLPLESAKISN